MLIAEYDYDTDIAVQREESLMLGIQQGKTLGRTEGSRQKALETAKLMLQHDYPPAEICLMTGLSQEELESV